MLVDPEFDSRHDLELLARTGKFFEFIPTGSQERVVGALAAVALRWSNDYRYRSSAAILKRLKAARLDRRVKGDPLKYSSAVIVTSAVEIVTTGLVRWRA